MPDAGDYPGALDTPSEEPAERRAGLDRDQQGGARRQGGGQAAAPGADIEDPGTVRRQLGDQLRRHRLAYGQPVPLLPRELVSQVPEGAPDQTAGGGAALLGRRRALAQPKQAFASGRRQDARDSVESLRVGGQGEGSVLERQGARTGLEDKAQRGTTESRQVRRLKAGAPGWSGLHGVGIAHRKPVYAGAEPSNLNQPEARPVSVAPSLGAALRALVEQLLLELGEDPYREGLLGTPARVAASLRHLTEGYAMDAAEVVGDALFEQECDEMVLVRDVPFYSLCEHHLLPFFGVAHVAYLPAGRVVGLSKIPRLVDLYAHRLQIQERMTQQLAQGLQAVTGARGVGVVLAARHLCLEMRGVERVGSQTVTSCMQGCFQADAGRRSELLQLVRAERDRDSAAGG